MSEGFRKAGFKPIFAIDANNNAVASYNANVANVAHVGEIAAAPVGLKSEVLIAGPPCQGFSTLGKRNPLDPRNSLSSLIVDWARDLECQIVVVENVKQFVQSENWLALCEEMHRIGFHSDLWKLDAAYFNTPQVRERCFTIFTRGRTPRRPAPTDKMKAVGSVFEAPVKRDDKMHVWPLPTSLALSRIKVVPEGGDKLDIMRAFPEICPPSWFNLGRNACGVWGRLNRQEPSKTIRCDFQNPSKGRHIHPVEDRVISLREGARIQGIPDTWDLKGTRTQISRQIGNGVPVPLAYEVAKSIAA